MTAVGVIDTVELPTFTEGVANIEETLPTEGEGVSLKNGVIPELTLSGVGVGVILTDDWMGVEVTGNNVTTVEVGVIMGVVTNDVAPMKDVTELF